MICGTLRQRLREFFVDVTDANVDFHLGDLFGAYRFPRCSLPPLSRVRF
jgi:hypothetical protein